MKKKPENFTKKLTRKTKSPASMLRALREREGLSQAGFAKKVKVSQSYISALEIKKHPISRKMAERIAKKFKMDIGLFYKEKK